MLETLRFEHSQLREYLQSDRSDDVFRVINFGKAKAFERDLINGESLRDSESHCGSPCNSDGKSLCVQ